MPPLRDVLFHPRLTARAVARSGGWEGRQALATFAALYSAGTLLAQAKGRRPQRSALMRVVPRERYYLWESVFQPPVTFAWMALFAGLVRAGARRAGGTATWRADFDALAIGHSVPLLVGMWLPDVVCYLLGVEEHRYHRLVAVYAPLATAWALAVSASGISEVERISWRRAAGIVVIADAASASATGIPAVMR